MNESDQSPPSVNKPVELNYLTDVIDRFQIFHEANALRIVAISRSPKRSIGMSVGFLCVSISLLMMSIVSISYASVEEYIRAAGFMLVSLVTWYAAVRGFAIQSEFYISQTEAYFVNMYFLLNHRINFKLTQLIICEIQEIKTEAIRESNAFYDDLEAGIQLRYRSLKNKTKKLCLFDGNLARMKDLASQINSRIQNDQQPPIAILTENEKSA